MRVHRASLCVTRNTLGNLLTRVTGNTERLRVQCYTTQAFALVRFGEGVLCQADSGSKPKIFSVYAKETDSPRLRWVLVEMAQLCYRLSERARPNQNFPTEDKRVDDKSPPGP